MDISQFLTQRPVRHFQNSLTQLYDKLLQQKQNLKQPLNEQPTTLNQPEIHLTTDPQYILGVVRIYRQSTDKQKESYGLADETKCFQFILNNKYLIVIACRLPQKYPEQTPVALYLPKSMTVSPQPYYQTYQLVIIRRTYNAKDVNFLEHPYVIIQPDHLIQATTICSWPQCKRSISIYQYLKSEYEITYQLVSGLACHSFLQWLIDNRAVSSLMTFSQCSSKIKQIYQEYLYEWYIVNKDTQKLTQLQNFEKYCSLSLQRIHQWFIKYVVKKSLIQLSKWPKITLQITEVIGSQTMHVSKYFGLKGKTDGLFRGIRHNKQTNTQQQVMVTFQLKTGQREFDNNRRQVQIYNLLLREKQKIPTLGILFYSFSGSQQIIEEKPQYAFENIMLNRNTILLNLDKLYRHPIIRLPEFTLNGNPCQKCRKNVQCEMFHIIQKLQSSSPSKYKRKYNPTIQRSPTVLTTNSQPKTQVQQLLDKISSDEQFEDQQTPATLNKQIEARINDLSFAEVKYVKKWMKALHCEERQAKQSMAKHLQKRINKFMIRPQQLENIKQQLSNEQVTSTPLKFTIQKTINSLDSLQTLSQFYQVSQKLRLIVPYLGIIEHCKILQIKKRHSIFYVQVQLTKTDIAFYKGNLQYAITNQHSVDAELQKYQNQAFSTLRYNVFNFVLGQNQNLKQLVIDDYQPKSKASQQELKIVKEIPISKEDFPNSNAYQLKAFKQVFSKGHCTLVEGMPGTGKTQLIIKLIQKCAKLQWKVLITTFTNRSLDNILQRTLKSQHVNQQKLIREGTFQSIDPQLVRFNSNTHKFQTVQQYRNFFDQKQFWFVTLSSVGSAHIPKNFDLVILDEASQSLQPACIQAISRGSKIVLIGDYKQLQPIVKSPIALALDMGVSLFQKLCKIPSNSPISLIYQYRMNNQIMHLSNELVYNDQLKAGDQQTQQKRIILNPQKLKFQLSQVIDILNPERPVVFLNHDRFTQQVNGSYVQVKQDIVSMLQVNLALFLFSKMVNLGIKPDNITIVCVYNRTVDIIKRLMAKNIAHQPSLNQHQPNRTFPQVLTIDKSQGIDKQVIILIAQNKTSIRNVLLQNPRRLNVALTRAQSKLIIIGSMNFLDEQNRVFDRKLPRLLRAIDAIRDVERSLIDHVLDKTTTPAATNQQTNQDVIDQLYNQSFEK